jgi:hypothetical protein
MVGCLGRLASNKSTIPLDICRPVAHGMLSAQHATEQVGTNSGQSNCKMPPALMKEKVGKWKQRDLPQEDRK